PALTDASIKLEDAVNLAQKKVQTDAVNALVFDAVITDVPLLAMNLKLPATVFSSYSVVAAVPARALFETSCLIGPTELGTAQPAIVKSRRPPATAASPCELVRARYCVAPSNDAALPSMPAACPTVPTSVRSISLRESRRVAPAPSSNRQ